MTTASTRLETDLRGLREEIEVMAVRVTEDLHRAVHALRNRDRALANQVRDDDRTVNSMQAHIQDRAVALIATKQPVARDLRELVASIRLADRLERIGDYAVHLAKTASRIGEGCWPAQCSMLARMAETGGTMLRKMTQAWMMQDVMEARACALLDREVDELQHRLTGLTLSMMRDRPDEVEEAVRLIRTAGFLERLADHVTNACELIEYMVEGTHPRPEKQERS
jgi:phosphate transport system protein